MVVEPEDGRDVTLIATGSEVSIALEAAKLLANGRHPRRRRLGAVLRTVPPAIARISRRRAREALRGSASRPRSKATGRAGSATSGEFVGMTGFGASAPADVLYREFGITAEAVATAALRCIARSRMAATHA